MEESGWLGGGVWALKVPAWVFYTLPLRILEERVMALGTNLPFVLSDEGWSGALTEELPFTARMTGHLMF